MIAMPAITSPTTRNMMAAGCSRSEKLILLTFEFGSITPIVPENNQSFTHVSTNLNIFKYTTKLKNRTNTKEDK